MLDARVISYYGGLSVAPLTNPFLHPAEPKYGKEVH
jgi:hypothetical protein